MEWCLKLDEEPRQLTDCDGMLRSVRFKVNGKPFVYNYNFPHTDMERVTFINIDEYREGVQEEVMETLCDIMDMGSEDRRDAFNTNEVGIWDLIKKYSYKELKDMYKTWKTSSEEQAKFEAACDAFYSTEEICDLIRKGYSFDIKMTKREE